MAASSANLKKAWAAPKEKVYRPSEKRKAANRANLAIAHARRRQQKEHIVHGLDTAFPPLRQACEDSGFPVLDLGSNTSAGNGGPERAVHTGAEVTPFPFEAREQQQAKTHEPSG